MDKPKVSDRDFDPGSTGQHDPQGSLAGNRANGQCREPPIRRPIQPWNRGRGGTFGTRPSPSLPAGRPPRFASQTPSPLIKGTYGNPLQPAESLDGP